MKSAGKARNNGLYRHIRTSKEIIRNLLNDYNSKKMTLVIARIRPNSMPTVLFGNSTSPIIPTKHIILIKTNLSCFIFAHLKPEIIQSI